MHARICLFALAMTACSTPAPAPESTADWELRAAHDFYVEAVELLLNEPLWPASAAVGLLPEPCSSPLVILDSEEVWPGSCPFTDFTQSDCTTADCGCTGWSERRIEQGRCLPGQGSWTVASGESRFWDGPAGRGGESLDLGAVDARGADEEYVHGGAYQVALRGDISGLSSDLSLVTVDRSRRPVLAELRGGRLEADLTVSTDDSLQARSLWGTLEWTDEAASRSIEFDVAYAAPHEWLTVSSGGVARVEIRDDLGIVRHHLSLLYGEDVTTTGCAEATFDGEPVGCLAVPL